MTFFIGPIVRWLFADIGLHGTIVVIISIFISVIVGKYLKEKLASAKTGVGNKNEFGEKQEFVGNIDKSLENDEVRKNQAKNTENESTENKKEYTRTESRRDIKRREREERRQERRERRNRW
ncbi:MULTISPECIES: hypothetical protein [Methanobacterium]|jgi:uncharacterized membrane protein|uniref:Uncharacterized protein n=1 Tax=Methanobacterium veterum TaxID=408577 RepID=A0A9E5DHC8_9EURY|nr:MULTISPECIES: hypothetical protein [Methanobacterium]MCZ3365591.1 hypothetical protein [Methanobacterium veterum]MCZ3371054.1 hypothetical protein [Methanobacterium veterum]